MYEIRDAIQSDIGELGELLASLFAQELEFEPNAELQREGLKRIICDPSVGKVLVAVQGLRIVGMVNILYTVSTALGATVALLEDLVVMPHARGCGVGKALIRAAYDRCRTKGCRRVTLLTDHDNHAAHHFYVKAGFERSSMVVFRYCVVES